MERRVHHGLLEAAHTAPAAALRPRLIASYPSDATPGQTIEIDLSCWNGWVLGCASRRGRGYIGWRARHVWMLLRSVPGVRLARIDPSSLDGGAGPGA